MSVVLNMNCTKSSTKIHLLAKECLFGNKRATSSVFRDVIGLYELDHVAIAAVNKKQEIIFLSHTPSMEYNLITSDLWRYDGSYLPSFYGEPDCVEWRALYDSSHFHELTHIKQVKTGFTEGISVSVKHEDIHLIFSFATKSKDASAEDTLYHQQKQLTQIGWYCFQRFTDILASYLGVSSRPSYLKLVVNNEGAHRV